MSISIEPTTSCNLRCPECPSGLRSFTRPTGMLDANQFKYFIKDLEKTLVAVNFYFQGEPFLNKNLLDMISIASKMNIYTSTSTNAHFLDNETAKKTVQSGLRRLIISIDGTTQEAYQQYRIGGDLEKVISGAKNIIHWKKVLRTRFPEVIFQFLVVRPNEQQIPEIMAMGREIGVDEVRFKTAQIYNYSEGNDLIPTNEKYSRYRKGADGRWRLKNRMDNHCWRMWQGCVITWDGSVVPCCFDKDASYRMGNLSRENFDIIWKSNQYRTFRKSILEGREQNDICRNCSEGTKVWA